MFLWGETSIIGKKYVLNKYEYLLKNAFKNIQNAKIFLVEEQGFLPGVLN